jgi:8-oxo-dGTP pyrophosphatase MutT (NUDIX family)
MTEGRSVGAIIKDKNGRFLVQYRLQVPLGLALPAGHIEPDEPAWEALAREILEETGIKVEDAREVLCDVAFPNPCAKNHDVHRWWVFDVVKWSGKLKLKEPTKHRFVEFMSAAEMKLYAIRGEVDPVWFDYIFPALGIAI